MKLTFDICSTYKILVLIKVFMQLLTSNSLVYLFL